MNSPPGTPGLALLLLVSRGATPKGAGAPPLVMDLLHSRGCPVGVWSPPPAPHVWGGGSTPTSLAVMRQRLRLVAVLCAG